MLEVDGDDPPRPVVRTSFRELTARLSPDGKWIAFVSDESGEHEVYVQPFPGPGEKRRVSRGGGYYPEWRGDGGELYYVTADNAIVATEIRSGNRIEFGAQVTLFTDTGIIDYDVAHDGEHFLVNSALPQSAASRPEVLLLMNWSVGSTR
jgi:Tol biopolymer transport system component